MITTVKITIKMTIITATTTVNSFIITIVKISTITKE